MTEARHHHYVPRFYLAGFSTGLERKARVFALDFETGKAFKPHVRNICGKRDFHRVKFDGVDPNAYETAYSLFEDEAAPVLKDVVSAKSFPSDDHFNVTMNLLALLSVRHPRLRANMHDSIARGYDIALGMMAATRERWESLAKKAGDKGYLPSDPASYDEVRSFLDNGEYDIHIEQSYFVQQEVELVDTVLPLLARRHWSFKLAGPDCEPACKIDPCIGVIGVQK